MPYADGIAQTCVTSPPYYGLRRYLPEGHPSADMELGTEQTPAAYVAQIVAAMREVWRVLRDDGTLWLNLGDSYANNGVSDPSKVGGFTGARIRAGAKGTMDSRPRAIPDGLKPKDLMGIPWRVAFALQDAGWYLRSDIIWAKPNPMPESVTDRCTKSHEYVFMLSKAPRYFYDGEAIRENVKESNTGDIRVRARTADGPLGGENQHNIERRDYAEIKGANARSVWTIATQPYSGAHFATMPPGLARRCILAGSRPGDIVLDPFAGSGTTAMVALQNGRRAIGTELNPAYLRLQDDRTEVTIGLGMVLA